MGSSNALPMFHGVQPNPAPIEVGLYLQPITVALRIGASDKRK